MPVARHHARGSLAGAPAWLPYSTGLFYDQLPAAGGPDPAQVMFAEVGTGAARGRISGAMLSAGFYVAKGRATDVKAESTIALTTASLRRGTASRHQLLGAAFLKRWKKSHVQVPADLPEHDRDAFEQAILDHPQFAG